MNWQTAPSFAALAEEKDSGDDMTPQAPTTTSKMPDHGGGRLNAMTASNSSLEQTAHTALATSRSQFGGQSQLGRVSGRFGHDEFPNRIAREAAARCSEEAQRRPQ